MLLTQLIERAWLSRFQRRRQHRAIMPRNATSSIPTVLNNFISTKHLELYPTILYLSYCQIYLHIKSITNKTILYFLGEICLQLIGYIIRYQSSCDDVICRPKYCNLKTNYAKTLVGRPKQLRSFISGATPGVPDKNNISSDKCCLQ